MASLLLPFLLLCCARHGAAWDYGIMVDAGSGGSRLNVFRWPIRVADPLRPLYGAVSVPEPVLTVSADPGISAFAHNVSALDGYFGRLFSQAEAELMHLREQWHLIPIYLKATAGARDLYQDQRDAIFARIRAIFFGCNFRFDSEYWARTISGEEEAVYAWLTVNALKGTYRADSAEITWGSLDMGGASTQIAFIPKDISIIQNYFPLHISYHDLHLYSHSFLEFGYRDANQRIVRMLMRNGGWQGTREDPIPHPCFPQGAPLEQPLSQTFSLERRSAWINGTGNLLECRKLVLELLNPDARCYVPARSREFAVDSRQGACGINGVYEPVVERRRFVAIGQYAKFAKQLGLAMNALVPLSDWMKGVAKLCAEDLQSSAFDQDLDDPDRLSLTHPPDPMAHPVSRCWKAVWLGSVLHKGLNFPLDVPQIVFSRDMFGKATGWALGAMMYEINYYPWCTEQIDGDFGLAARAPAPPGGAGGAGLPGAILLAAGWLLTALGSGWCLAARWAARASGPCRGLAYCHLAA